MIWPQTFRQSTAHTGSNKFQNFFFPPLLLGSVLFGLLPTAREVQGQIPGIGGLDVAEVNGKLDAASGNRLKITGDDGQDYLVSLNQQSTIDYEGTAEPEFLRPGMLVRFTCSFDTNGQPQQAVSELEIFQPMQRRRMRPDEMQKQTPGIYPVVAPEARQQSQQPQHQRRQQPAPQQPPASAEATQEYRIVGKVMGIEQGRMQVMAGNRPVMVELEPELKVTVASGDLTFSNPGDQIKVSGLVNAAQPNFIQAESVRIEGAEPLKPPEQFAPNKRGDQAQPKRQRRDRRARKQPLEENSEVPDKQSIDP